MTEQTVNRERRSLYVWGPEYPELLESLERRGLAVEVLPDGRGSLEGLRDNGGGVLVCPPLDQKRRDQLAVLGPTSVILELAPEREEPVLVESLHGLRHLQVPPLVLAGVAEVLGWAGPLAGYHCYTAERLTQVLHVIGTFRLAGGAEGIYDRLTAEVVEHFGFQRSMLFLRRGGQMELRSLSWPQASPGVAELLRETLQDTPPRLVPESPEFEALSLGMATPVEVGQSEFLPPQARELMAPTREIALVPLFSDQELLGVLTADFGENTERLLGISDLALLDTLASVVGTLIYNSWLYSELEQRNRQLERRVRELTVASEMTRILNSGDDPRQGVDEMLAVVARVLEADSGFLFLYNDEREELSLAGDYNLPEHARSLWQRLPGMPLDFLLELPKTTFRPPAQGSPEGGPMLPGANGPTLVRVLRTQERVVGLWGLAREAGAKDFNADDEKVLSIADSQITVALNSLRLRHLASTDALTELFTLRHFRDALEQELGLGARLGYAVSLALIDVDHFKKINDTYGHPAGDVVLAELGAVLRACTRRGDICARIGGEEFAVVIPRCGEDCAWGVAEKIRLQMAENPIRVDDKEIAVTVSLGLATQEPGQELTREEMIRRADSALYVSKRRGRNQVFAYHPDEDQETWGTL